MSRIDVKAIRQNLKMTQEEFAAHIGASKGAVRDWEQGRCEPAGPTRVLLMVLARKPEAVSQTIEAA
jgi:putative transcriptional regulator